MAPSTARAHHYVAQFYLNRFSDTETEEGYLHVFPRDGSPMRRQRPSEVAQQRDLHRINDAENPNRIEDLLAMFDGWAAPVFQEILDTQRLPREKGPYGRLMSYLALMETRTLRAMVLMEKAIREAYLGGLRARASTPEAKKVLERPNFVVEVPKEYLIAQVLRSQDWVFPYFAERNWGLLRATGAAEFVTSDHPISVRWITEELDKRALDLARPRDPETEIFVPLGRRLGLVGRYEPVPPRRPISDHVVAAYNGRTVGQCIEYALAGQTSPFFLEDGQLVRIEHLSERFRDRPLSRELVAGKQLRQRWRRQRRDKRPS